MSLHMQNAAHLAQDSRRAEVNPAAHVVTPTPPYRPAMPSLLTTAAMARGTVDPLSCTTILHCLTQPTTFQKSQAAMLSTLWPGWPKACIRVLIVSIGYIAMCSEMPATAPASICCSKRLISSFEQDGATLQLLSVRRSGELTETKLRPPYCDSSQPPDRVPGPPSACEGPAALDENCRSWSGSMRCRLLKITCNSSITQRQCVANQHEQCQQLQSWRICSLKLAA